MERMWSFLRRFNRMTKEMRPAHRVDILTHALLYYAHSAKRALRKKIQLYILYVVMYILFSFFA